MRIRFLSASLTPHQVKITGMLSQLRFAKRMSLRQIDIKLLSKMGGDMDGVHGRDLDSRL